MDFSDNRPIYQQIGEWVCNKILAHEWKAGERILSVRELGALLEVNPNTVMRTYERLQAQEIIYNRRGIGYFVSPGAEAVILREQRERFFEEELSALFRRMELLGIGMDEVERRFSQRADAKGEA